MLGTSFSVLVVLLLGFLCYIFLQLIQHFHWSFAIKTHLLGALCDLVLVLETKTLYTDGQKSEAVLNVLFMSCSIQWWLLSSLWC